MPAAPPPPPTPTKPVNVPTSAPVSNSTTPRNSAPCSVGAGPAGASAVPGALPPSPIAMSKFHLDSLREQRSLQIIPAGFPASSPTTTTTVGSAPTKTRGIINPESVSSSSPETQEADDFVMVPAHLTMDAAENRKTQANRGARLGSTTRRHTVSGERPSNLPMQFGPTSEPIPVPTQKAAYQQIQASLVRSRSRSGDSVCAMSGISSASGGSTLGPLPEERPVLKNNDRMEQSPAGVRKHARVSPLTSPSNPRGRKTSAQPIPDICQMSPPNVQFTLGTPPTTSTATFGHRRRTSSSSSCGTPPPGWQISPNSPKTGGVGKVVPTMQSPRRSGVNIPSSLGNIPALSPIQGSPNKGASATVPEGLDNKALMQWENNSIVGSAGATRAVTVPENLSGYQDPERRRSTEIQLVTGRNVVLNYGGSSAGAAGAAGAFDRSSTYI